MHRFLADSLSELAQDHRLGQEHINRHNEAKKKWIAARRRRLRRCFFRVKLTLDIKLSPDT